MKNRKSPFAPALLGALCVYAGSAVAVATKGYADDLTLTPLKASSFNIGGKHLVSYFITADNNCRLTVLIGEATDDETVKETAPASRLQLAVDPGKSARLDTADGGAASFACAEDTQSMRVSKIERLAAAPAVE